MKSGIRTTEFWLTLAFHVSAIVMVVLKNVDTEYAVIAMAVAQGVYNYARTEAKKAGGNAAAQIATAEAYREAEERKQIREQQESDK